MRSDICPQCGGRAVEAKTTSGVPTGKIVCWECGRFTDRCNVAKCAPKGHVKLEAYLDARGRESGASRTTMATEGRAEPNAAAANPAAVLMRDIREAMPR